MNPLNTEQSQPKEEIERQVRFNETPKQRVLPVDDLFYDGLIRSYVDPPGFVEHPWRAQRVEVGRGVDLTWLLQPAKGDTALLLKQLHHILAGSIKPDPWADDWVQKRLVRALAKLGVMAALPNLLRLREQLGSTTEKSAAQERLSRERCD